ncbi:type II toxin-antitoxin system PemK/MazF family toxin [Nocardioides pacificus]
MSFLSRALSQVLGSRPPAAATATANTTGATYAPEADGHPDPGEVVWAWVAYEDDAAQGKDRPVLIVAEDGDAWLGLYLTSKDHDRDAADEARWGRHWMDVGTGGWDRQGRPSEVRLDRLLRFERADVRREGAALGRATFDAVVAEARRFHAL